MNRSNHCLHHNRRGKGVRVAGNTVRVIPYDKWSHERIRGLLTYMRYTNRRILYFSLYFVMNHVQIGYVPVGITILCQHVLITSIDNHTIRYDRRD